ncbi:serologically defined colon cancer antigen 8 isoform X2 [Prorops nasuta]|uniref:serologically defined colon cancer antigen 8 isoform X2 n=1 Tax=Prorops nasuta TaxID=863751 RepID=UPI0034CE8C9D
MLGSSYSRRSRFIGTSTASPTTFTSYLLRPKFPLRSYFRPKIIPSLTSYTADITGRPCRRLKTRKINAFPKMDVGKKKVTDYTEVTYREAVSKLKYLLAESYAAPRNTTTGRPYIRHFYRNGNTKINESVGDADDRSYISECSRSREVQGRDPSPSKSPYSSATIRNTKPCGNLVPAITDHSVPPELMSFIEKQEEYIEQLEQESQYCRDELSNLLAKVREVVAENEVLHSRTKTGFLRGALTERKSLRNTENGRSQGEEEGEGGEAEETAVIDGDEGTRGSKKSKLYPVLEGPSIVFESRISELEAQLTQARLELRKAQEGKGSSTRPEEYSGSSELKIQLDQALRSKYEAEVKLEEIQKNLSMLRDRELDATHKVKRSIDMAQQAEFEKAQAEAEVRRLRDELERQHERIREATHETSKRISEERQQIERRYSQQVEQLSADIAAHWDAASKSQLEAEKQRRELAELRRDLNQKQLLIDSLKKELQNKISMLQSDLSQALTEKDSAEQEILAGKLATERIERQARQEQSRLQTEINSYKQRLERADADLVHCRRENLRLTEQISSLEKEINMSKMAKLEENKDQGKADKDKELTTMIMEMESKHASTVAGLEGTLNSQATLVSQLSAECQSLTQRLEANSIKHKEEMASLQDNIKYLSNKIQNTIDKQTVNSSIMSNNEQSYVYDNISRNPVDQQQGIIQSATDMIQTGYNAMSEQNVHDKAEIENLEATHEYSLQNEDHNIQDKYQMNNQDYENYPTEQQYSEYDQYNPSQYDQNYMQDGQYSMKAETQDEAQYDQQSNKNTTN